MQYKPHDYQKFAVDFIETHPEAAVLLECGLGKTSITLTALNDMMFDRFEIHKVLIIAPIRVCRNSWAAEIEKWDHLKGMTYSLVLGSREQRLAALRRKADLYIINRENVQRKIVISGNVYERDLRSIVDEIQQKVDASIQLPEGYHIEYGGQFESEQAASRTLLLTSLMSLLVIFLLLYNEFKDAKESGVVLLNLPLALIGGVFILKLTSGEVSIPAIIGFISLFGIATRNGMLLISHYTHLRTVENVPLKQAVLQGSMDRLNPILMTALSSALALIPLALNGDLPGNEIQSPMATVILGGLLTSTFLNGFIIPIVYLLMNKEDKE